MAKVMIFIGKGGVIAVQVVLFLGTRVKTIMGSDAHRPLRLRNKIDSVGWAKISSTFILPFCLDSFLL